MPIDSLTVELTITSSVARGARFPGRSGANKYKDYWPTKRTEARCPKQRRRVRRAVAPCICCRPRSKSEIIATRGARGRHSGGDRCKFYLRYSRTYLTAVFIEPRFIRVKMMNQFCVETIQFSRLITISHIYKKKKRVQGMESLWRRRRLRYSHVDREGLVSRAVLQRVGERSLYAGPGEIRWRQSRRSQVRTGGSHVLRCLQEILPQLAVSDEIGRSGKIAMRWRTLQCPIRETCTSLRLRAKLQEFALQRLSTG